MSELVFNDSAYITEWVIDKIPHVRDFGPCYSIGVVSGDRLLAGVVYHDYQKAYESVQISMAAVSPMWARKEIIHGLLKFPFENLKCYRVFTLTPQDNTKAIAVNKSIGFLQEATAHSGFGKNRHAVSMRLLKPDYFRLYGEYTDGKRQPRSDCS